MLDFIGDIVIDAILHLLGKTIRSGISEQEEPLLDQPISERSTARRKHRRHRPKRQKKDAIPPNRR